MYEVRWDKETGGILLTDPASETQNVGVRPVFHQELQLLGFDREWSFPESPQPLLWATAGRRYIHCGECVAEAIGGGFFERPQIIFHKKNILLQPIDVQRMVQKNDTLMNGLIQEAIAFIRTTHDRYSKRIDATAVAFSGGKDSLVLLDLVQRALAPNEFVAVFSDTSMEISATVKAVAQAQEKWPHLQFYTARAAKNAETTWREFGPPSRIHRWCCTVHKSAPSLLLLRKITGKSQLRALVYDGVRWEESQARAGYQLISEGGKHKTQINASPILRWSSAEVFLYLFARDILLNDAYRYGLVRVGCAVCPLASKWWDAIAHTVYSKDTEVFVNIIKEYAYAKGIKPSEINNFITDGGWKGRAGGQNYEFGGNRVTETLDDGVWKFHIRHPRCEWMEWAKTLGPIIMLSQDSGIIDIKERQFSFELKKHKNGLEVNVLGIGRSDRLFLSRLRAVNNKVAYCTQCQGCQVECPVGAISVNGFIQVDPALCVHCGNCLSITDKGCLVGKSLAVSNGGTTMKGLNRYQHFGMRAKWLYDYFSDPENWWHQNSLGNRQFEAMKVWLRETEIVRGNQITALGSKLRGLGTDSELLWGIIWINLARNSALIQWYSNTIDWGSNLSKNDLVDKIDHSLSQSTRQNAITTLVGLLRDTPLGNKLGLGEIKTEGQTTFIKKKGWISIHQLSVLYSLYRYAEKVQRYDLLLRELYSNAAEGPYALFGILREELIPILRGISSKYEGWISVELVKDLDNIYLDQNRKAEDVLSLD